MSELLSCPFCGKPPVTDTLGGRGFMIECMAVNCVNPHTSYVKKADAIAAWNKRISGSTGTGAGITEPEEAHGVLRPAPGDIDEPAVWISERDLEFLSAGSYRKAPAFNYEDDHRVPLYRSPPALQNAGQPLSGDGWQPIETAPKDGTWFAGQTTHHKVMPARWNDRLQAFEIANIKLRLNKWKPLPEPEPRPLIRLLGSAALSGDGER